MNLTIGGLLGYSSLNCIVSLKVPSSNGVSLGLGNRSVDLLILFLCMRLHYPNMTAFHNMMLLSVGAPLTPAGGSSCNLHRVRSMGKEGVSLIWLKRWMGGAL